MNKSLQNLVLFKAGWLACVFLAAVGRPALATLAVASVVAIHLYRSPVPVKESAFLVCAGLIGLMWETFMVQAGFIEYPASNAAGGWAPYWIVAMWVLFATTVNHGFSWLKRHWILTVAFGLVGGPMAFLGGAAMGAAQFSNTAVSMAVIGVGWAIMFPLLALISDIITDSELLEPGFRNKSQAAASGLVNSLGRPGHNV